MDPLIVLTTLNSLFLNNARKGTGPCECASVYFTPSPSKHALSDVFIRLLPAINWHILVRVIVRIVHIGNNSYSPILFSGVVYIRSCSSVFTHICRC